MSHREDLQSQHASLKPPRHAQASNVRGSFPAPNNHEEPIVLTLTMHLRPFSTTNNRPEEEVSSSHDQADCAIKSISTSSNFAGFPEAASENGSEADLISARTTLASAAPISADSSSSSRDNEQRAARSPRTDIASWISATNNASDDISDAESCTSYAGCVVRHVQVPDAGEIFLSVRFFVCINGCQCNRFNFSVSVDDATDAASDETQAGSIPEDNRSTGKEDSSDERARQAPTSMTACPNCDASIEVYDLTRESVTHNCPICHASINLYELFFSDDTQPDNEIATSTGRNPGFDSSIEERPVPDD